jgi:hypothetical protein
VVLNPDLPRELEGVFARGLAKEPTGRYESCAELVAALRAAFDTAAGGTVVHRPQSRSRLPLALGLLAAAAVALAGVALGLSLLGGEEPRAVSTAPRPQTVRETVTLEGTTVVETVTTAPPPPTTTPTTEPASEEPTASPSELNDEGFQLMQAGEYQAALPLLEQAVAARSGDLTEAYASYNLAFTRLSLGRCDGVLELLARSEQLQGERKEISRLRREAERSCGDG